MRSDGSAPRPLVSSPGEDAGGRYSPDGSRIAFWSAREGNTDLFLADADGSNPVNLTRHPDTVYELAWSPDGHTLAFYSDRTGRFELYLVAAAGGEPRRLTSPAYDNAWPAWSRDGKTIVFSSNRDGDWEVYTMARDGQAQRRLTRAPGRDAHPGFFPDGRIVFQSPRADTAPGEVDLYVMNGDGSGVRRIVAAPGFDGVPVPSPEGSRVAFQRGVRSGAAYHWELLVADSGGRGERQLTRNRWSSQVPGWSPDGRSLVFFADREGNNRLYVMDVEQGIVRALPAPQAGADNAAAFSPEGERLAFISTRDQPAGEGAGDLYVMHRSGGNLSRLTTNLALQAQPAWAPDGRSILVSGSANSRVEIYLVNLDTGTAERLTRGLEGIR
jgi:TolB protein